MDIPIVFSANDSYCPITSVAIKSLLENANKKYKYKIFVLATDLQYSNKILLENLVADYSYSDLTFVDMKPYVDSIGKNNFYTSDYFSVDAYYRVFIPAALPQYDKVLYLDGDLLILGDVSELFNIEIGNCYFGATKDLGCQMMACYNEDVKAYFERIKLPSAEEYFQSGVLLMNTKVLRDEMLIEKFSDKLKETKPPLFWVDQDIFNLISFGRVHFIDLSWDLVLNTLDQQHVNNAKAKEFFSLFKNELHGTPKIVHYCGKFWRRLDFLGLQSFGNMLRQFLCLFIMSCLIGGKNMRRLLKEIGSVI